MGKSSSTGVSSVAFIREVSSVIATPTFDGSRWRRLPTELRLQILRYYLTVPNSIKRQTHFALLRMRVLPILLTKDKEFVEYVKAVYYGSNTFLMTPEDILHNRSLPRHIGQHIRHLVFPINSITDHSTNWPGYQGHWEAIWGASLPILDSLSVIMTIQEADKYYDYIGGNRWTRGIEPCILTQRSAHKYITTLKPKIRALNPKKVTFVVLCEGCPFRFDHRGLHCSCASEFEEGITQQILEVPEPTTARQDGSTPSLLSTKLCSSVA